MKLYDSTISDLEALLEGYSKQSLDMDVDWTDVGKGEIILKGDMAYELGGGMLPGYGTSAITEDAALVAEDEVILIGPDLGEIKADSPFARISVVRVKEGSLGEGDNLYKAVRDIEYVKYRVNPKGYMPRVSSGGSREPVRIGKKPIAEGMGFSQVGRVYLDAYHMNNRVEAVKLIFITDRDFDYKNLESFILKTEGITKTIDHVLKDIEMDCGVCGLKNICDEVEGLKELHFSQSKP
jgi:CO dehydrogenase/acetyl-CoA synthase beta subunit